MPRKPPDPRNLLPSRAHPEHRAVRKNLEKEHHFGYTEPILLGMLGLTLAFNIEDSVRKHEERKDKEEEERTKREDRERRRRERAIRNGTWDPRRRASVSNGDRPSDHGGSDRGSSRDTRDNRDSRHRSVDRRGPPPRTNDRYYPENRGPDGPEPRYNERYPYERYDPRYDDRRDVGSSRGSRRRDSF
ncbi:hypothetical protein F5Y15DRAFT_12960 [Xylariaceae sp. FL0016]|nr:hypothetical protein F5Y15DRAFT_12960 [Xylariaceae sp. FL0016]